MNYEKQTERLRELAARLLLDGAAEVVLGLRENEETGFPTPVFVQTPENANKLIWNESCFTNLAAYLPELKGKKTAIAAKACDVRSAVNLMAEHQIAREQVIFIGMECTGMRKEGALAPGCDACPGSVPGLSDFAVGAEGTDTFSDLPMPGGAENVTQWLNASTVEERAERFSREIDKCILCFACRQACPGCYCETCFIDRKRSPWDQSDLNRGEKAAFHLTRAMHLAGRCTGCGACERVCASGVKLLYLYGGLREFVSDIYHYRAGEDPDAKPAMSTYSMEDPEIGFLGGEGG